LRPGTEAKPGNKEYAMAAVNAVTDLTREGDIAVLTINSPPVNALSADVRNGLRGGVEQTLR
jgi:3-hydroxyacyl-CoA dehydrogenase